MGRQTIPQLNSVLGKFWQLGVEMRNKNVWIRNLSPVGLSLCEDAGACVESHLSGPHFPYGDLSPNLRVQRKNGCGNGSSRRTWRRMWKKISCQGSSEHFLFNIHVQSCEKGSKTRAFMRPLLPYPFCGVNPTNCGVNPPASHSMIKSLSVSFLKY